MGALTRYQPALIYLLTVLSLAGLGGRVHAQTHEDSAPPVQVLPGSYLAAMQAMDAKNWPLARALLQQTLAQHPNQAGAWLDLALVALAQGDLAQADELLSYLTEQFSPLPPNIEHVTISLRLRIDQQRLHAPLSLINNQSANVARKTTILLGAGYDSNANAGLRADDITLNLPSGDLLLQLAPSSRTQSADFLQAAVAHSGQDEWLGKSWVWQMVVQARSYASLSNYSLLEISGQVRTPLSMASDTWVGGSWRSVWLGGEWAYHAPSLFWMQKGSLENPWAAPDLQCAWSQQARYESKRYPRTPALAGQSLQYQLEFDCAGQGRGGWFGQAELASDVPQSGYRPGGQTRQVKLQLGHAWANLVGYTDHQLHASAEATYTTDSEPYSPWLGHGSQRWIRRNEWQLTWTFPLGIAAPPAWSAAVGLQGYQQRSNIALFSLGGVTAQLSAWRAW